MKNLKYLLVSISFIPPLVLVFCPVFKSGWPLIGVSTISVITLGLYLVKSSLRFDLEKNQGSNLFLSFLDCFLAMGSLIASYTMTLIVAIELTFKYDLNSTVISILCLLVAIPVFKSWRRIILNFIKTT
jgi:hypothetical protein